ncbi:MAG: DUF3467 domain-containing protein [Phycisphaerae bacterium]
MAKEKTQDTPAADATLDEQARQQTGQQQVRLRVDERELRTSYANAFRTNATAEEVMMDFGINQIVPIPEAAQAEANAQAEIRFTVNERIILNFYSAKRLAITLSQLVRRHEEQFGEIELNVADRRVDQGK